MEKEDEQSAEQKCSSLKLDVSMLYLNEQFLHTTRVRPFIFREGLPIDSMLPEEEVRESGLADTVSTDLLLLLIPHAIIFPLGGEVDTSRPNSRKCALNIPYIMQ